MWVYALIFLLIHNIKAENEVTYWDNEFCDGEPFEFSNLEVCTILDEKGSYKFTCNGDDWKLLVFDTRDDCTGDFKTGDGTGKSGVCNKFSQTSWIRVNCPNSKSKSTLTTEAIIGITIGVLFMVFIIAFIFRKQLFPKRFASQTGEQLIQ